MPIYAFECAACGHSFDCLQRLSDPDPTDCPNCAEAGLRRQLTAPAFRLAGSGWYETDFKSKDEKKRNLAGAEASSGPPATPSGDTPAGKSDGASATPAAKPETKAAATSAT